MSKPHDRFTKCQKNKLSGILPSSSKMRNAIG